MNCTNSNQQKLNLRSKMNEFKYMVNGLEDMARESVSRCFSMEDYEDEDREDDNEYPNCVAFWTNYHAEAEKVTKFYMAHFYYNDSMTMKESRKPHERVQPRCVQNRFSRSNGAIWWRRRSAM